MLFGLPVVTIVGSGTLVLVVVILVVLFGPVVDVVPVRLVLPLLVLFVAVVDGTLVLVVVIFVVLFGPVDVVPVTIVLPLLVLFVAVVEGTLVLVVVVFVVLFGSEWTGQNFTSSGFSDIREGMHWVSGLSFSPKGQTPNFSFTAFIMLFSYFGAFIHHLCSVKAFTENTISQMAEAV